MKLWKKKLTDCFVLLLCVVQLWSLSGIQVAANNPSFAKEKHVEESEKDKIKLTAGFSTELTQIMFQVDSIMRTAKVEENDAPLVSSGIYTDPTMLLSGTKMHELTNQNLLTPQEVEVLEKVQTNENDEIIEEVEEEVEDVIEEFIYEVTECEPYTMYVTDTVLRVRSEPRDTYDESIIGKLKAYKKVTIVGEVDESWVEISYKDGYGFINRNYLTEMNYEDSTYNHTWDGTILNSVNGHINGPSGDETYYNLDMSFIIDRLHRRGYEGDYWVRSDGVKMFGDYVLVAANFDIRPIGTILETSLGMGIVADTGGFVSTRPYGLDIAVTW